MKRNKIISIFLGVAFKFLFAYFIMDMNLVQAVILTIVLTIGSALIDYWMEKRKE
jgi:nicotinamide riboside transporter PnuC